jgi:hypothetical protein
VPPQPGPDYIWVEGYHYPQGPHYLWHDGYWTRPPYEGAYWVEPYHVGGRYFAGQWEGSRGIVAHDHRWDRGTQRDERRDPRPDGRSENRRRARTDGPQASCAVSRHNPTYMLMAPACSQLNTPQNRFAVS